MSPALAGRFLTTVPPGKSLSFHFLDVSFEAQMFLILMKTNFSIFFLLSLMLLVLYLRDHCLIQGHKIYLFIYIFKKYLFICLFILAALGVRYGMQGLHFGMRDLLVVALFLVVACELPVVACMQDLVPQSGIEPRPPTLGAWSPPHWITKEVPVTKIYACVSS